MNEEQITLVPEAEPEFKSTLTQAELDAATAEITGRSFSGRHPELGKMINCAVCSRRHRASIKCEQRFAYTVKDKDGRLYAQYREVEGENGEATLTPDYRTAIPANAKPTRRQVVGAPPRPNQFVGPRLKPHHSKNMLQFIERVRVVYGAWDIFFKANLVRVEDDNLRDKIGETYDSQFKDRLHKARSVALHQLREERRAERKRRRKLGIR